MNRLPLEVPTPAPSEAVGTGSKLSTPVASTEAVGTGSKLSTPVASTEAVGTSSQLRTLVASRKTYTLMGVEITGTGSFVPARVVTNADLKQTKGFDPAWIEQRSGISERHHVSADVATSDRWVEARGGSLQ